jgi:hypothetical protein
MTFTEISGGSKDVEIMINHEDHIFFKSEKNWYHKLAKVRRKVSWCRRTEINNVKLKNRLNINKR